MSIQNINYQECNWNLWKPTLWHNTAVWKLVYRFTINKSPLPLSVFSTSLSVDTKSCTPMFPCQQMKFSIETNDCTLLFLFARQQCRFQKCHVEKNDLLKYMHIVSRCEKFRVPPVFQPATRNNRLKGFLFCCESFANVWLYSIL